MNALSVCATLSLPSFAGETSDGGRVSVSAIWNAERVLCSSAENRRPLCTVTQRYSGAPDWTLLGDPKQAF